ncbi:MAG: repeat-associated core domain protein, partial [Mucilaginibacter sp.]|nr:repeat-associated core domain protein [Mucilaginibacter sp.]
ATEYYGAKNGTTYTFNPYGGKEVGRVSDPSNANHVYIIYSGAWKQVSNSTANQEGFNLRSSFLKVTFDPGANQVVNIRTALVFMELMYLAHTDLGVNSINISSTTNHPTNASRSRHTTGLAFDINYINGVHVSNDPNSPIYDIEYDLFDELLETDRVVGEQFLEYYSPVIQERWTTEGITTWPSVAPGHQNHIHISLQ